MPSLRVMTYNIHHGRGMDDVVDLPRIAAIIAAAEPDIVSVQEVDRGKARTGRVDQPAELARLTGLTPIYGPAILSEDDGEYGNLALTRLPAREVANVPMPGEPRAALTLSCEAPGSAEFLFIATHFDTKAEQREKAPGIIERYLGTRAPTPAILAGDLNARPLAETMRLLGAHWENATEGEELPTIYPNDSGKQIDYVLYRPAEAWRVTGFRVPHERIASDHLPLIVDMECVVG
ncbi:endonuclease [Candidatus Poribacteria bacterium]|jgi:endonuclease/exonuclease/phosphatase family metal-dependent hydrolase|nr:endonuclease [Candidatus Poribacteria bacterium]MBT5532842.1 endonuclease [Candidatus Poribacteria bacterium]MBT5710474.1 endonuclease [Candidatus Poribacteria bacterium]MBT7100451.1 endonuclease [Candidatus Poribacteria bacterium]MBT7804938.1 endonuclease [Candidatus Poribacteria bacterium]